MSAIDLQSERLSEDCLNVLGSYAVREAAVKAGNSENPGWLDRIDEMPGVNARELTVIHGLLIAQGILKFEVTGRSAGLQYQISSTGREILQRQSAGSADRVDSGDAGTEIIGSPSPADATVVPQRGAA